MTKKKDNKEKPVEFYKEKDVLGLDKPDPDKLTESPQKRVEKTATPKKAAKRPKRKKPWVASLLSLFMLGLGHVYAGKIKKGVFIYLGLILITLSIRFLAFNFYIFVGLITIIVGYYLYVIIDAFISVKRNSDVTPKKHDKWYVYLSIIVLQAVLLEIAPKGALDKITPINFHHIPATSMNPTLQAGDLVATQRTKGIKTNDVVVFKYPEDTATLFIFRCIGMPGDNVEIKNARAHVNDKMIDNIEKRKYQYIIMTNGQPLNQRIFDRYGITDYQVYDNTYFVFLTEKESKEFAKISIVEDVTRRVENSDNSSMLFPKSDSTGWTVDNYGPIYIPKKDEKINLTKSNFYLYASLIQQENRNCSITDSTVQIDNKVIEDYIFKRNYYFVLGDNRHNALDSRYWGFVREDYIVGKGLYLYWAKNSDRVGQKIE